MKHHLFVGTWTPPGRIYTIQFDDEQLSLDVVKKTDIPEAEPISWMAISVCIRFICVRPCLTACSMTRRLSTGRP